MTRTRPVERLVGRLEHEGVVDVAAGRDRVRVGGREQPPTVLRGAEQGREAGARVEAGQAQPVDRAAAADEGGGAEVAEHGVVLDRRGHVRTHGGEYAVPPGRAAAGRGASGRDGATSAP